MTVKKMFLNVLFITVVLSLTSCGAFADYALPENDVRELNDAVRKSLRECNYNFVVLGHTQLIAGQEPSRQWFDVHAGLCVTRFERVIYLAENLRSKAELPRHRDSLDSTIRMFNQEIQMVEFLRACYGRAEDRAAKLGCFKQAFNLMPR